MALALDNSLLDIIYAGTFSGLHPLLLCSDLLLVHLFKSSWDLVFLGIHGKTASSLGQCSQP